MLISHLLPAPVHASERYGDDENAELFLVEAAQIAGAVSTRRAEYATVRRCARIALVGLGYLPSPILRSAQGNPVWPGGVVGSMTHCRSYRAAVVTDESSLRSIGIDAEVRILLYAEWEVLHSRAFVFDDDSDGIPHRHAAEEHVFRKHL